VRVNRVLVIDDDMANAELMRVILDDAGLSVTVAYTARDLPSGDFAAVVTDLVATRAYSLDDARDWLLSLRDRYGRAALILATAHRDAVTDADALGVRVIVKPFDVDVLVAIVRDAIAS
jgi:DNA-binding NtrC family response regulator